MAISFSSLRKFSTHNIPNHLFSNSTVASQSFKIRIDSAHPGSIPDLLIAFDRNSVFCFTHYFLHGGGPTVRFVVQLNGVAGFASHEFALTIGVVYVFAIVWDGTNHVQTCWSNAAPTVMGHLSGLTTNRVDPVDMGPNLAQSALTYTLDDFNAWDNYALTQADAVVLTNNGDPTTIGTSASWRCRWTLSGTTGQTAAVGNSGLKNAYGTGAADGSDFASVTGPGTAIYADPLVWEPSVTPHVYVAGSGKNIGATFTSNFGGLPQIPSQLLSAPTIKVNGVDHGALTIPWGGHTTGVHQCMLFSTPGTPPLEVGPTDVVELTAPPAWANTPAGSVAALSGTITNLVGRSSVGVDDVVKTLRIGMGVNAAGRNEYYPFRNAKFRTFGPNDNFKFPPNSLEYVAFDACEAGKVLVVWDAVNPATPILFTLTTGDPTRVTVTHDPTFDASPSDGIGYVRAYDISYKGDYLTKNAGATIRLQNADPVTTGRAHYNNLWIYLAGEWDIVDGAAVFDRSDQWALSRFFLSNLTANLGSIRFLNSTICTAECYGLPYPEILQKRPPTVECFWSGNPVTLPDMGFISAGPVDPAVFPWFYSAQFKAADQLFSATLTDTITTTPSPGTQETWHFSDGATAPLMAGLEIKVDDEVCRIISGSGTDWVVYRGSNGTTPATHSPGPVVVYGREPISTKVKPDGTAGYTAPVLMTTAAPHGMTTLHTYFPHLTASIVMADGTVATNFLSWAYVTGPDTFVSIWPGFYVNKPNGTKPARVFTLDPTKNYVQFRYSHAMPIQVCCDMVSRFPHAAIQINIPPDACDDLMRYVAWTVRDHFPDGRDIILEYCNEPWNFSFPYRANQFTSIMQPMAMPSALNTYPLAYYTYRSVQCAQIFDDVFTRAGRTNKILLVNNCQMGSSGNQMRPALDLALTIGRPIDAIAIAPYYGMCVTGHGLSATVAAFDQLDDDQACEMLTHDLTYDTTGMVALLKDARGAVDSYNAAHGKSCDLVTYEGGSSQLEPTGAATGEYRRHDMFYNPNFYFVEQCWYKLLQDAGLRYVQEVTLGYGWPYPYAFYHFRTQKHSRGDGLNGASDNRAHTIAQLWDGHYHSEQVQPQDLLCDSPRGQALVDWLDAIASPLVGTGTGGEAMGGRATVMGRFGAITHGGLILGGDWFHVGLLVIGGGEILGGFVSVQLFFNTAPVGGMSMSGIPRAGITYLPGSQGGMMESGRVNFGPVYSTFLAALTATIQASPQLRLLYGGTPRVFTTWPGSKVNLPFILIENYVESQPGEAIEHNRIFVQLAVYGADQTTVRRYGRALQDTVDSPNQNRRSIREPMSWLTGDEQGCNRQPTTPPVRTGQLFYGTDLFRWGLMYQFEFVPLFQL